MAQNALAAFVAQNPSLALVPLKVSADGSLIVVSDSGGDAVTLAAGAVAAGAYVAGSILNGADVTQGLKADAAWTTGDGTVIALLKALANGTGMPAGAVAVTGASGNVAAASAVATLAAAASKTTYITGFQITAGGATGAALVTATVVGTITGTLSYTFATPVGATLGATPLTVSFPVPVPASAVNTAIVVTLPSLGTGNLNATVVATGFQL